LRPPYVYLKSARVTFQNYACHRCKNSAGVSCEHLRLTTGPFQRAQGLLLKNSACHRSKNSARVSCEHLRLPYVIEKNARVAFQKYACHRCKNSEGVKTKITKLFGRNNLINTLFVFSTSMAIGIKL
jgi:transposase-like protein